MKKLERIKLKKFEELTNKEESSLLGGYSTYSSIRTFTSTGEQMDTGTTDDTPPGPIWC